MLALSLLEGALESAPDAIIIADAAGRIVFANRSAEWLFGYTGAQMRGEPVELLLPGNDGARHRALRGDFITAPCTRAMGAGFDLRARRRDGVQFPVEIALSPSTDGTRPLVIAAIRDISERKRIEGELGAARQAAEQARQRACEARDLADRANLSKSRFLATASHDLRQPLQSLALLNGMLRRGARDPAVLEALQRQERAIGAMSRLVNALLDIGKLESGTIRPQIAEFAVLPLLGQLRQEFTELAQAKGLALRFEAQAGTVRTDAALLEQVLRNLMSNALKYTQRGEIALRCVLEPPLARIEVCDTGIGIAESQLPLIFHEFFQVDTAPRNGYGLGLSIVNRIVKLLGLKLEVQSAPGAGSRFRLTVPAGTQSLAAAPPEHSAQARRDPLPATRAPRILLVEDEAAVRSATALLLRAFGYEVLCGASQADAFAQLDGSVHIDLLISDYHLGGEQTGTDVIATVRARLGADLPAILLSGDTSMSVQGLQYEEHLRVASKPLQAEELLGLIGELLQR